METMLIPSEAFDSLEKLANWTNDLVGRSAPNNANYRIKKVIHFQVIPRGDKLAVMAMVETERKKSMSSMVINMRKDLGLNEEEQE